MEIESKLGDQKSYTSSNKIFLILFPFELVFHTLVPHVGINST